MNILYWLAVVGWSLCVAVFLWMAAMSIIGRPRNKAQRQLVSQDAPDDQEHRTEAELPVRLDDGPLAPLDEEEQR